MKWGSEPGLRKRATGSVKVLRLSLQGEGGERNEMDKAHSLEQTVHRPEEELSPLGLCRGATSPGGSGQVSREATSRVSRPGVKRTAVPPRRGGTCSLSHCSDHPSASPTLSLPLPGTASYSETSNNNLLTPEYRFLSSLVPRSGRVIYQLIPTQAEGREAAVAPLPQDWET